MAYDIGPRIGIKGEKEFNDQINNINQNLKILGSEMKEVTSRFSDNGESQDALTEKSRVMQKQLENQSQKLKLVEQQLEKETDKMQQLAKAVEDASKEFGENSIEVKKAETAYKNQEKTVSNLRVGVNETKTYINKLSGEIKENKTALNEMDNGLRDAATGMKKAGNEADDLKDDLEDVKDTASDAGEAFKGAFAGAALAESLNSIGDSIKNVTEESKEYIKIMGALNTSSELAGYTTEQTAETYVQLYGILGDDQTAATTTANLQALGLSQKKLHELTEGAIGAWAKYGDSIPIDGLAESINETVKVGKVTGTFADVLNWAGTSEDGFNEKLQSTKDKTERANMVLKELSEQGLTQSADKYRENQKSLVDNNEAQAELNDELAEFSKSMLPFLTTLTEMGTALLEMYNSLPAPIQGLIIGIGGMALTLSQLAPLILALKAMGIGGALSSLETLITGTMIPSIGGMLTALAPFLPWIALAVAAIAGIILVIKNWTQITDFFGKKWQEMCKFASKDSDDFFGDLKDIMKSAMTVIEGLVDFVAGVFTGDWRRAWKGIEKIFSGIVGGFVNIFKVPINAIIDGINWFIGGINSIHLPNWKILGEYAGIGFNIGKIPRLKVGMDFVPSDYFPAFLDYGEAVLTKEQNAKLRALGGIEALENGNFKGLNPEIKKQYNISENRETIVENKIYLDGKVIAKLTERYITKGQKSRNLVRGV